MAPKLPEVLATDVLDDTANILRCLGHPLRLRVLDLLEKKGECTVTEIQTALDVEQAVASQHLTTMWDKGILDRRKEGVYVHYSIGDARALKVLACVRQDDDPSDRR
ncbi:MAG: metalloregulator ArsR/SmtB family transcription factor [Longimicrobiales bacterium]|nr:metalloregulator ArsR/SmtB family transcription factor [Longimicrobiales bacterium]